MASFSDDEASKMAGAAAAAGTAAGSTSGSTPSPSALASTATSTNNNINDAGTAVTSTAATAAAGFSTDTVAAAGALRVTPSPTLAATSTSTVTSKATTSHSKTPTEFSTTTALAATVDTPAAQRASTAAAAQESSATVNDDDDGARLPEEAAVIKERVDYSQLQLDEIFERQTQHKFDGIPQYVAPQGFKEDVQLYDFQKDGVRWLLHQEVSQDRIGPFWREVELGYAKNKWWKCSLTNKHQKTRPVCNSGSLLCDSMGLGKSLQTIGLMLSNMPEADADAHCTLIVAPLSVIAAWRLQFHKFVEPGVFNVATYHGPGREKELKKVMRGQTNVLLTSYETIVSDYKALQEILEEAEEEKAEAAKEKAKQKKKKTKHCEIQDAWTSKGGGSDSEDFEPDESEDEDDHYLPTYASNKRKSRKAPPKTWIFDIPFWRIVLDEAHTIRNGNTGKFSATTALSGEHKLCITGTPYINKPKDLHSLFSFLGAEPLSDKKIFSDKIQVPIENCREIGLSRIRTLMSHLALRRTKAAVDSVINLVPKEVVLRRVEWTEGTHKDVHEAMYKAARAAFVSMLGKGSKLLFANFYRFLVWVLRVRQSACSSLLVPEDDILLAQEFCREMDDGDLEDSDGGIDLDAKEGAALLAKLMSTLQDDDAQKDHYDKECVVCFNELEDENAAVLRSCKHVLCDACINQIESRGQSQCPLCRTSFGSKDIIKLAVAEAAAKKTSKKSQTKSKKKSVRSKKDCTDHELTPKEQAVLEEIDNMEDDSKGLLFSQWTTHLDHVQEMLERNGHTCTRIDGSMNTDERLAAMQEFDSDEEDSPRFMLCSLMACGTGITLTRANYCFMLDAWWNFSLEQQAMDRVHRIGQTRPVRVVRFIMEDSLEERMVDLQDAKTALGNGSLRKLNAAERKQARITALKDLFEVGKIEQKWDGHYDDDDEEDDDESGSLNGFIVDDDVSD